MTTQLLAGVVAAKKGTDQDREKAVATLIVGVKQIQDKVAKHLVEMKAETKVMPTDDMPAEESPLSAGHAEMPMDKMTLILFKFGKKIAAEIKDPANKHNPKVLMDIKLFLAVKDSVC